MPSVSREIGGSEGRNIGEVLMAYVDESGNSGAPELSGGSLTYALGCVVVDADTWNYTFDELVKFRRRLRITYGIGTRAEIKASSLLRNSGDLRPYGLSPAERHLIFRAHMRVLGEAGARAFAVVVDKRDSDSDWIELAWEGLLQRLDRTSQGEGQSFMLFHDEGEDEAIRKRLRRARRYMTAGSAFGTGQIQAPATRLIEDGVAKRSHQSYLIQLADLVAYAAWRVVIPPGPAIRQICDERMWDEIGSATLTKVTGLRPRSKPGVVLR